MFKEILRFHVEQAITSLFKRYLSLIEDLREEHRVRFDKLKEWLPSEYHPCLDLADYFDENKYNYYRKRVLDMGNDAKRSINQSFEHHEAVESSISG